MRRKTKTGHIDLWTKISIVIVVCQALFSVYRLVRQPSKKAYKRIGKYK